MSATMTVFFVERTGHVLGAVTRNSGDDQASRKGPIPEDVLIRFLDGSQALIPGKELSTLVVAPLPDLLLAPLYFHAPKATDAPPGTEPRPKEVKRLPDLVVTVKVFVDGVEVGFTAKVDKDEKVWILVSGGTLASPIFIEGFIEKDQDKKLFPSPSLDKDVIYQVLALVEEKPTVLGAFKAEMH
ncbi:MAG TPA: hypothetical protein VGS22_13705 [Thermoanaerobaculia bacterium]|jgi:hypothetical protein|nr:hypothetical protein [Thermoanaerobaculia bacterium]